MTDVVERGISQDDDAAGTTALSELADNTGVPEFNGRLSDKLPAAFNHAYAVGELDIADSLRDILAGIDADSNDGVERRDEDGTLGQAANLWIRFVGALSRLS
jgi:hypothetical protein